MFNLDVLFSVSNIILFMAIITRISGLFAAAPMFSTAEVKNRKTGIYQFREIIG